MAFLQIIFFFLLFPLSSSLFPPSAFSLAVKDVPNPKTTANVFVQDSAKILDSSSFSKIDQVSEDLEKNSSIEMAIVTVESLEGLTVEDYAEQLFKKWGIGKKASDNGILILFALKDRKVRVEVGYGLEGTLTDAKAKRFIEDYAIPQFKNKNYAQGLYDLSSHIAELVGGSKSQDQNLDSTAPTENQTEEISTSTPSPPNSYFFLKILFIQLVGAYLIWLVLKWSLEKEKAKAAREDILKTWGSGIFVILFIGNFLLCFFSIFISNSQTPLDTVGLFGDLFIGTIASMFVFGIPRSKYSEALKNYVLICPQCHQGMRLISEHEDDQFLDPQEIAEESAEGMNYEFWVCDHCLHKERFNVKLSGDHECPQCKRRSLKVTRRTVESATEYSTGLMLITKNCYNPNCKFHEEKNQIIPKIASSSSSSGGFSSSSGGGSFGGGSSGGGGASGSW